MPRFDPVWLDVQYNNRARLPEHPEILARWERASAFARGGKDIQRFGRRRPVRDVDAA